ncbi:MAG TPA: hypothetical protein VFH22_15445 [Rhodocyclaceae bacterium]|nr:hypothetical protein [Rhodocyclaceae bacterium]
MKTTIPDLTQDPDHPRIIRRPDGFYWLDEETEYGPFETSAKAIEDMHIIEASDYEPCETLEEAESEVGIAEWLDPETGEPAEGLAPRLEEH